MNASSKALKILIVDDQRLMREGLRTLLELEDDLAVVGDVEDGSGVVAAYTELNPDVVLMDVRMPEVNGVEATRRLRSCFSNARIIILTTFDDDEYVFEAIRAGASGFLLKDISGAKLAEAIRTVAAGGALLEPSVTRSVLREFTRLAPRAAKPSALIPEPLSDREIKILELIAQGLTNRQIAVRIYLAEGTVKNYVTTILQKLDVRDRTQAAIRARELGIT